jgi:hypothetical protein
MNTNDPGYEVLVRDQHILSLKAEIVRLEAERDVRNRALELIADVALDRDGYTGNADKLAGLVDEIRQYAIEACRPDRRDAMSKLMPDELEIIRRAWLRDYVFDQPGQVVRSYDRDFGLLLDHITAVEAERDGWRWVASPFKMSDGHIGPPESQSAILREWARQVDAERGYETVLSVYLKDIALVFDNLEPTTK